MHPRERALFTHLIVADNQLIEAQDRALGMTVHQQIIEIRKPLVALTKELSERP